MGSNGAIALHEMDRNVSIKLKSSEYPIQTTHRGSGIFSNFPVKPCFQK